MLVSVLHRRYHHICASIISMLISVFWCCFSTLLLASLHRCWYQLFDAGIRTLLLVSLHPVLVSVLLCWYQCWYQSFYAVSILYLVLVWLHWSLYNNFDADISISMLVLLTCYLYHCIDWHRCWYQYFVVAVITSVPVTILRCWH